MKSSTRANRRLRKLALPFLALAALSGTAAAQTSFSLQLAQGWNLLGNSLNQALNVASAALFGDATKVISVWKWNSATSNWAIYSPTLSAADLQTFATSKGYGVLSTINAGEGYWVNAKNTVNLGTQSGAPATPTLVPGWNMIGSGANVSPSAFNAGQTAVTINSIWAWNTPSSSWYFYAPSLDAQGGTVLSDYVARVGFLNFSASGKLVGNGTGLWVNAVARGSTTTQTATTTTTAAATTTTAAATTTTAAATTTTSVAAGTTTTVATTTTTAAATTTTAAATTTTAAATTTTTAAPTTTTTTAATTTTTAATTTTTHAATTTTTVATTTTTTAGGGGLPLPGVPPADQNLTLIQQQGYLLYHHKDSSGNYDYCMFCHNPPALRAGYTTDDIINALGSYPTMAAQVGGKVSNDQISQIAAYLASPNALTDDQ